MHHVPEIFREEEHTSRSQSYMYIPTITVLKNLQQEDSQPFFACQTRVRDQSRREYAKHMLRLWRAGRITDQHVPEIIPLNSHDGPSSYRTLPGYFRAACTNDLVCGQSLGEVRVPRRRNVMGRVIEGVYEVVDVPDLIERKRDAIQSLILPLPACQVLVQVTLTYRYGDEHQLATTTDILTPRRREDYGKGLQSAYRTIQENVLKGGTSSRSAKEKRIYTRAVHSIDTDIKLNRALWMMAGTLLESLRRCRFPESTVLFTAVPSPRHSTIHLFFIGNNLIATFSHNSTTPSISMAATSGNNRSQSVTTPVPGGQHISS